MKIFRIFLLFTLVIAITPFNLLSQKDDKESNNNTPFGRITGKIFEADSSKPLIGVTVILHRELDSSQVTGTFSDKSGNFKLENIALGRYYLLVRSIGYRELKIRPVWITENRKDYTLNHIKLYAQAVTTGAVEVTGYKDLLQSGLDKTVIQVEKNLTALGGSATDVMKTIPSVTVDIDGNVSLRGSANVRILVDGKPSGLSSTDILDMIPASQIESIELITNPSAKYDPESSAGIINIVLKKERDSGTNGMMSINAGTGDKYNASVNLNYRTTDFNLFGSYNARYWSMAGYNQINQKNTKPDTIFTILQREDYGRHGGFHSIRLGIDYFINPDNQLTFSALPHFGKRNNGELLSFDELKTPIGRYNYFTRHNDESFPFNSQDYSLNYKNNLGKNHELTTDVFMSSSERDFTSDYVHKDYSVDSNKTISPNYNSLVLSRTRNNNKGFNFTVQADYKRPVNAQGSFQAGYKSSIRYADMDFIYNNYDSFSNAWLNDTKKSNHFIYDETIHAGYLIYSNSIIGINYQIGLRGEQSLITTDLRTTNEKNNKSYFSFFPSVHFKYEASPVVSYMLSYSRRINRPSTRSLNPFTDYDDPLNLSSGNPNLDPEYPNVFELGGAFILPDITITSNLFFRQTNNSITDISVMLDSMVTLETPRNLELVRNYGMELIMQHELFEWWRYDWNLSYYRQEVRGEFIYKGETKDLTENHNSWNAKFNTFFSYNKFLEFQVSGYYSAPSVSAQVRNGESYSFDAGMKIILMDGNFSINMRGGDIFHTYKNLYVTKGANGNFSFLIDTRRIRESQVFYLGISYKFNNFSRPNDRRNGNGGQDIFDLD
ncbi:MAG: Outer rane receptor protein [Ignavibacteria bacterium]|nr:Outer rane receptor protein [Ignavibacteria bacterium]